MRQYLDRLNLRPGDWSLARPMGETFGVFLRRLHETG